MISDLEKTLKEPYMELYTISVDKEASVHFGLEGQKIGLALGISYLFMISMMGNYRG